VQKNTDDLTVCFAHLGSSRIKAACKTFMKLTPGNESWIAYDPLYTAAGLLGSPMFTKELQHKSFIQIFPSSKLTSPTSKQISILGWIRPDALNEGTVLVNNHLFRYHIINSLILPSTLVFCC